MSEFQQQINKNLFTFIVGGKAGEGVKKAGNVASKLFIEKGRYVFQLDDYMSLIRGGHNFSVVTTSTQNVYSHYMHADLIVNFDKRSYDMHVNHLKDDGIIIYNSDEMNGEKGIGVPLTNEAKKFKEKKLLFGVGAVAILACSIGMEKSKLAEVIRNEYPKAIEDNISYANIIYDHVNDKLKNTFEIETGDKKRPLLTGNEAIAFGAIAGGLDVYFGYPMTPASSILHVLAANAEKFGLAVVHPENEIAVINMAIGSAFTGAKAMVGTSGGGFALMVEGYSLAGMSETPLLCIYSMRPGPATGVPTYTEQGDLNFALNAGHGDFLRVVASPSSVAEAFYLTSEMLDLVSKFQTPGILLTEKHLSESSMTVDLELEKALWAEPKMHKTGKYKRYLDTDDGVSPLLFPPSKEIIKWTSYEHDEMGITTENSELIHKMHEKRNKKESSLIQYLKQKNTVNIHGDSGPLIFTYGSTTLSTLEAVNSGKIEATIIQPIYLRPFPIWEIKKYENDKPITIEMSVSGQFTNLIKEKANIEVKSLITKFDGRPFDPVNLAKKIKEVI